MAYSEEAETSLWISIKSSNFLSYDKVDERHKKTGKIILGWRENGVTVCLKGSHIDKSENPSDSDNL